MREQIKGQTTNDMQDYGDETFFFILNIIHPYTCAVFSYIRIKLDTMNMSPLQKYVSKTVVLHGIWHRKLVTHGMTSTCNMRHSNDRIE